MPGFLTGGATKPASKNSAAYGWNEKMPPKSETHFKNDEMKPFLNSFRTLYLSQTTNLFKDRYFANGLKPIEAFYSDISNNLVKWAAKDDCVYYETKNFWYRFQIEATDVGEMAGIVWMRRFEIDSKDEICDFANKH
jgi:hypothetical protein